MTPEESSQNSTMASFHDGKITLAVPDNYHVLTSQEIAEMGNKAAAKNNWAMRNEELHVIVNVAWKKISFLAKGMALSRVAENTKRALKKANKTSVIRRDVQKTIAGGEAFGFRYTYTVQDLNMIAEYLITSHNGEYYSFIYIAREGGFESNYVTFQNMLDTAVFK